MTGRYDGEEEEEERDGEMVDEWWETRDEGHSTIV
jgi:hypothetical protein